MIKTFHLPDLGEGLAEAEIVRWKVNVGDTVQVDQPMLEVENAKALMEVPVPFAGKIVKLYAKAGEVLETHKPLVDIETNEVETEVKKDAGSVVGAVAEGHEIIQERVVSVGGNRVNGSAGVKATPVVRALARQLGVELGSVIPSGKDSQILAQDVEQFAQKAQNLEGAEQLKGSRRTMAKAMQDSHREVAPATLMEDADIEVWSKDSVPMLRLIRAMIAACKAEPVLNSWFDGKTVSRQTFKQVDLGVAMDLGEEGLFVPVLRKADELKSDQLQTAYQQLKEKMKARTLLPEDLRGNTITLSNVGTIAGRYASPVVVPPTVAILAAGKMRPEVVAVDGKAVVHKVMPLSLTFDHRAVTGGEAARFLAAVIEDLQKIS